MTRKKAFDAADTAHRETGRVIHVWRKNLLLNASYRGHMQYDFAPFADGLCPVGAEWDRVGTVGAHDAQGVLIP